MSKKRKAISPFLLRLSFVDFGLFLNLILQHGHFSYVFFTKTSHIEQYLSFPSLYDEDFTKTHKEKSTFSNDTTNELIHQIEEEIKIEATSGNYGDNFEGLTQFELQTTRPQEFARKDLMYAE